MQGAGVYLDVVDGLLDLVCLGGGKDELARCQRGLVGRGQLFVKAVEERDHC